MAVGALTLDVDTAVGVAVHPDHGGDPEALLQRAELAANAAKVAAVRRAAVPPGPGVPRGAPPGHRRRPAPGPRQRRARGLLPAQGHPRRPAPGRRRVPGPLEPPGARRGRPGGLRRGGRAHRPALPAHRGGARPRACAAAGSGRTPTGRSPSRSTCRPAPCSTPASPTRWPQLLDQLRRGRRPGDLRDLRAGHARRHRAGAADALPAARPRGAAQRRRLRHRRLLAVLPAAVAGARGQDRRQLRAGHGDRLGRSGDRAGGGRACPASSA